MACRLFAFAFLNSVFGGSAQSASDPGP